MRRARCEFDGDGLYRLRLHSDGGAETAEDDLFVSVEAPESARTYPNRGASVDLGPDRNVYEISAVRKGSRPPDQPLAVFRTRQPFALPRFPR
jgi:hypothetical protein